MTRGSTSTSYDGRVGVGLGFRRLSIIDLDTGNQPIANEDGSVQLVFNGEIYNFRELREELEARGHRFATNADTEVIVHLYEEHRRALRRAAERHVRVRALGRRARRELLLARDRFGKKPLYYADSDDSLLFGSELKALLQHPSCPRELDPTSLARYLALEYVPTRASIFEGVAEAPRRTRPALARRPDVGRAYWDLSFDERDATPLTDDEYADELREQLRDGRPAPPGERRSARRVPERRHRLELGRRA